MTDHTVTLAQAESLAIRYCAYMIAARDEGRRDRDLEITVWGPMLLEVQRAMGSTLMNEEATERTIEHAKRRLNEAAARARYLRVCQWARKRYNKGGSVILSAGCKPSAFTRIERAAYDKYVGGKHEV